VPACDLEGASQVAHQLQAALQARDPAAQVLLSPDLQLASRCNAQVLLASPGVANRQQLAQLQQNLLLQGRPVAGLLLLRHAR
jgi:acetyl esterase/lipase